MLQVGYSFSNHICVDLDTITPLTNSIHIPVTQLPSLTFHNTPSDTECLIHIRTRTHSHSHTTYTITHSHTRTHSGSHTHTFTLGHTFTCTQIDTYKHANIHMHTHTLTISRDLERICRMSSMVFSTVPLHSRWGNLASKRTPISNIH